jgi:hypothetical protein
MLLLHSLLFVTLVLAADFDAVQDSRQLVFLNGTGDSDASCLDGSPFAFWIWPGNSSEWSIFINGGGWCLNEDECELRTKNAYGSSLGYNLTGPFAPAGGSGGYSVAATPAKALTLTALACIFRTVTAAASHLCVIRHGQFPAAIPPCTSKASATWNAP